MIFVNIRKSINLGRWHKSWCVFKVSKADVRAFLCPNAKDIDARLLTYDIWVWSFQALRHKDLE
jgi:hypothetical protein